MPEITDLYVDICLWWTQRTQNILKPAGGVDIMAYRSLINIALFMFLILAVHGQEEDKRM
jgi:hypothetical protein